MEKPISQLVTDIGENDEKLQKKAWFMLRSHVNVLALTGGWVSIPPVLRFGPKKTKLPF